MAAGCFVRLVTCIQNERSPGSRFALCSALAFMRENGETHDWWEAAGRRKR